MIYLAFYRGRGRFLSDTLVQRITRSAFSHCELFISTTPPAAGQTHRCITAVGKEGGVCIRDLTFDDAYEFVPIPWAPRDTFERASRHMGGGYDYWGLLMTQLVNLRRHTADRWFCSKLCARALGLADAHTYAPGDLKRIVEEHNRTFYAATQGITHRSVAQRPRKTPVLPIFPGSGTFADGLSAARNSIGARLPSNTGKPGLGGGAFAQTASQRPVARERGPVSAGRPLPSAQIVQFPGHGRMAK